ncbi:MAG: amino acid ABC transporter permease [Ectothiorhodospiraceae bacterium]|nr:amino acid ABC transporter permease [Chromatiales bacterium]MCP5154165.1 amino acid ABC transporter permease [Ectothiorhodospiraceae bacterium]
MRQKNRSRYLGDLLIYLAIIGAALWGLRIATTAQAYNWQWYNVPQYLYKIHEGVVYPGPLLRGLITTMQISAGAMVIAAVLGLLVAVLGMSGSRVGRILARGYIEVVRNIPILVLLFLFYFVVAPIFGLGRFASGMLTLALYEAAFAAEIYRAGIEGVPRGQREAAAAVGLTRAQQMRYVVLPQSIPLILPPMTNLAINLIKHSAIVSVIAIFDLANEGRNVISETFMVFEVWFTVALVYLVITTALSFLATGLERRFARSRASARAR